MTGVGARTSRSRLRGAGITLVLAALVGVTAYVYGAVGHHAFVSFDDLGDVTENPAVNRGLSPAGFVWAWTTANTAGWVPVTWLSHMADRQLFGLAPGPPHLEQVVWHLAASILLFVFLIRATGRVTRSAFVAAVFAVHPLHVESVAWLSERKDVLSACFGLAALLAYTRFLSQRNVTRYLVIVATYALGLLAKPMLVTLPCCLLLLDLWPLGRLPLAEATPDEPLRTRFGALVLEKVPLFAMAVATSVLAVLSQRQSGAVMSLELLPIPLRIENALVSYVRYLRELVWPAHLAPFYPWPAAYGRSEVLAAGLVLLAVTLVALSQVRRRPYLLVGWLWFVGTLVPVIGLIQVGAQSMADRYMYLPSIGLLIIVAWGIPDLCDLCARLRLGDGRPLAVAAGVLAIAALAVVAKRQVSYWTDSVTLWQRAVAVSPASYRLHFYLATALDDAGQFEPAVVEYETAVQIAPQFVEGRDDLSPPPVYPNAHAQLTQAVRRAPRSADAHNDYGRSLAEEGRRAEAMAQYNEAIRLRPDFADAYANESAALVEQGETTWATQSYAAAVRLDPNRADWQLDLAVLLTSVNRPVEAIRHLEAAERVRHLPLAEQLLHTLRHHAEQPR